MIAAWSGSMTCRDASGALPAAWRAVAEFRVARATADAASDRFERQARIGDNCHLRGAR